MFGASKGILLEERTGDWRHVVTMLMSSHLQPGRLSKGVQRIWTQRRTCHIYTAERRLNNIFILWTSAVRIKEGGFVRLRRIRLQQRGREEKRRLWHHNPLVNLRGLLTSNTTSLLTNHLSRTASFHFRVAGPQLTGTEMHVFICPTVHRQIITSKKSGICRVRGQSGSKLKLPL